MQRFKPFKKERQKHWCWDMKDLQQHNINEKVMGDWESPNKDRAELHRGIELRNGNVVNFRRDNSRDRHGYSADNYAEKFNHDHHSIISEYKGYSEHINTPLRYNDQIMIERNKNKTKNLDFVTSQKTENHAVTYRGMTNDTFKSLKKGNEFVDHGYTGTSFKKNIAWEFAEPHPKTGKKVIAKIHIPVGSHGHYIDHTNIERNHAMEKEFLLHRGTKFKVLGHTEDTHHHYVHLKVTGNINKS